MIEYTISGFTVAAFAVNMLLGVLLSFGLMLWCRIRFRANFKPFFIGVVACLVAGYMLMQIVHMAFMEFPFSEAVMANPWLRALYMGISTALVEETARLWLCRSMLRKQHGNDFNGLMYGIGQGGAEALYLLNLGMAINYLAAFLIYRGEASVLLEGLEGEDLTMALEKLELLTTTAPLDIFMMGLERIHYSIMHIALSSIVWFCVNQRFMTLKPYALALVLRVVYQGVITLLSALEMPSAVTQCVGLVLSLGCAAAAVWVWKRHHVPAPEGVQ